MSDSENTNGKEALDYFKNLTSDPSDHIISLQDMEKTIKFHEDELAAEDKRVEGTDEYPNYGDDFADMVYIARRLLDEIERLREERDEARREVCGFHHLTGFLSGDYAISRGWDCYKNYSGEGFPQSVKDFKEFLKATSEENLKSFERLWEENRKLREMKIHGVVSEPVKATPPKYDLGEDQ